jgi:hypothetical protein
MRRRPHAGRFFAASLTAGILALVVAPVDPAAASGQVCIGVVIDDGTGSAPTIQAAQVAPGTSDLNAMSADGDSVTQNNAGLVCAINNYPANGLLNCLGTSGTLFYYWSYWEGDPYTNTWTYANIGPAEHAVGAGQTYVAGWRYQDPGPDNPTAPKPSVTPAAAFAQTCPGVAPVAPSSGGGGSSSGSGSSGSGSSSGGATSNASANTSAQAAAPATPPAGVAPSASAPAAGSGGSQPKPATKTTPTTGATRSSVPSSGTSSSTATTTARTGTTRPASSRPAKLALASTAHRGASGGDPALPIVLVAVLIGLIGAVAWFRWRRRPAEE